MTRIKTPIPFKARTKIKEEEVLYGKPHPGRRMTEAEFVEWCDEETRAEWVDGEVILMSPVNVDRDAIQIWFLRLVAEFVERHNLGRVCGSELFVRLPVRHSRRLPDIFLVLDAHAGNFKQSSFDGSPDLAVEIVSPSSVSRDYRDKFSDYESSGVKEYWIIDPLSRKVEVHELVKGKYRQLPVHDGAIHSSLLKGFFVRPVWFWQERLPKVADVLREMGVT